MGVKSVAWAFLGVLLLMVLGGGVYLYLTQLRPVPAFEPTGEFSVGATNFDFEFRSEMTGGLRRLNIRAWYPSDAGEGEINPVISQRMAEKMAEFYGMPDFMATSENSLSFRDAPIAEGSKKFPVLVFNHGFGSFAEQNTTNMQELASNGYLVFSISHPGQSLLTEYADGTYVYNDGELPAFVEQLDVERAIENTRNSIEAAARNASEAESFEQYWQGMAELAKSPPFANMQPFLRAWVEDSNALINAIAQGRSEQFPAMLAGRMDGEKIGIFGHSLGGMAAIAASMGNSNIRAVINIDGPFAFDEPAGNIELPVPTCMLMSEGLAGAGEIAGMADINTPLMEVAASGSCVAIFRGAWHMNFTDMNYISFLRLLGVLGPVNQEKFGQEFNNLLVSFFDRELKGDDIEYVPLYDFIVEYTRY